MDQSSLEGSTKNVAWLKERWVIRKPKGLSQIALRNLAAPWPACEQGRRGNSLCQARFQFHFALLGTGSLRSYSGCCAGKPDFTEAD